MTSQCVTQNRQVVVVALHASRGSASAIHPRCPNRARTSSHSPCSAASAAARYGGCCGADSDAVAATGTDGGAAPAAPTSAKRDAPPGSVKSFPWLAAREEELREKARRLHETSSFDPSSKAYAML